MEKISVIVPVYNVEKYLRDCLDSIINQTYNNLEIILVDDGSTDNSLAILKEYESKDSRVVLYTKKNGGLSDARNFGIEKSSGEYIGFVDSDDKIDLRMFEVLYCLLKENDSDISMCNFLRSDEELKNEGICVNTYLKNEIFNDILLDKVSAHSWDKLYKRYLFADIRFPKGYHFEDLAIFYLLVDKINKITISNEKLYFYRVNRKNSITASDKNAIFNSVCIADIYRSKTKFSYDKNIDSKYEVLKMAIKYNTDTYRVCKKNKVYLDELDKIREFISNYYMDVKNSKTDVLKQIFCYLIKNRII